MTIFILLGGFFCSTMFLWRDNRHISMFGFLCCSVVTILIATGLLQRPLLYSLQHPFMKEADINWQIPSIIILLGGGEIQAEDSVIPSLAGNARILKTAQLYHTCQKTQHTCRIIVSGGDPGHHQAQEARVYANILASVGINIADMLLEPNSRNTFEEADYIKSMLAHLEYKQLILVTSAYHLQRSHYVFDAFGISTIPVASDFLSIEKSTEISSNFVTMDHLLHEYLGMLCYAIKYYVRSIS